MNQRTQELSTRFKPALAVVVYSGEGLNRYYLESHDIDAEGQLKAGKPLKQETMQEIIDVFFDERKNKSQLNGLMPYHLLAYEELPGGQNKLIWYREQEVRQIYFSSSLHIPSGKAWVPALLYVVERRKLSVYALLNDKRPNEKTKLCRAPFHNVSSEGDVCLGNAQVKKPSVKTFAAEMKYWEDLFWLSEFSHLNGSGNPTRSNINLLWKKMVNSKQELKWNTLNELIAMKKITLNEIL